MLCRVLSPYEALRTDGTVTCQLFWRSWKAVWSWTSFLLVANSAIKKVIYFGSGWPGYSYLFPLYICMLVQGSRVLTMLLPLCFFLWWFYIKDQKLKLEFKTLKHVDRVLGKRVDEWSCESSDCVSWLQMQGSGHSDSLWCVSALCFRVKLSEQWGELWKGKTLFFFNCTSHKISWLKDFQGTGGGQLWNNFKLNT